MANVLPRLLQLYLKTGSSEDLQAKVHVPGLHVTSQISGHIHDSSLGLGALLVFRDFFRFNFYKNRKAVDICSFMAFDALKK